MISTDSISRNSRPGAAVRARLGLVIAAALAAAAAAALLFAGAPGALARAAAPAADVSAGAKAAVTPWTPDDILLAESSGEWEISPDGSRAVWVKAQMDREKNGRVANLFLTDLASGQEIPLTRGTETNSRPRWSPDGRWIAFVGSRPLPKPKPEITGSQLWLMSISGGEPYPVTEMARGLQDYRWVDSGTIIFSAQEDPTLFDQERKKAKDTTRVVDDVAHEPPVRLFKLTVKDKTVTRLTQNTDFIQTWAASPDGRKAVTVNARDLSFEWDNKVLPRTVLWDLEKGEGTELFAGRRIVPSALEWAPDGGGFYVLAPYTTDPKFFTAVITVVYFYDLASGSDVRVGLEWPNGVGGGFKATPDGFLTLLASGVRFQPARYVKKGLAWKRADIQGRHAANIFDFALSDDAKTMVYDRSTAATPSQWYRARLDGNRLVGEAQLTDLNPGYKAKTAARTEIVRWTGALGEEVEGILYYPKDYQPGKRYPLFTAPHGGPAGADMDMWDEGYAYPQQLVCQRGAFVLRPNYHGSSNYGLAFVESICCGHYYDYPVEDIQKGVDSLIARGLVDSDKIGTFGWSNGSILSIAVSVADPDRYKVVGAGAGDVEFISDWANVDFGESFDAYYLGKSLLEDPELYLRISPLFQMDKVKAPTIIFFGTEDRNVPTGQGWTHYRALYHLGRVPVRFCLFPGEPHGLREYAHQARKVEEEMAWFDRYFFKTLQPENEALKKDSPLGRALRLRGAAHVGAAYGTAGNAAGVLVPEVVKRNGLEVGRFEVTRAQYAAFDKSYTVAPGTENYPANGVPFEKAAAYAAWLSETTGRKWRLLSEEEAAKLYEMPGEGNTLDYWAGYSLNPDDAGRLQAKIAELGDGAPLLKEAGSFAGEGREGEEPLFDLGGNVAEWVAAEGGGGKAVGRSADRPADAKARAVAAAPEYTGFRVVRAEPKK